MSGSRKLFLFVALPLVLIAGGAIWFASRDNSSPKTATSSENKNSTSCSAMVSPTDISKATAVLYPGQTRGGHYKAHGGFRFDGAKNDDISVKAPLDAKVTAGSRYIEQGEIQYLFDFETDCGLEYRFDHLKTLSAKFQAAAETLPTAEPDNSQTSNIKNFSVTAGELIATGVGFENSPSGAPVGPNVSFDFGVYDKTKRNAASTDPTWAKEREAEKDQAWYGVCWFDLLPAADAAIVKSLPGGDSTAGKTSDFCE